MLSHMDKVLGTRADGYDELHGPRHDHDEGHAAHHEGHLQPRRLAGRAALARAGRCSTSWYCTACCEHCLSSGEMPCTAETQRPIAQARSRSCMTLVMI